MFRIAFALAVLAPILAAPIAYSQSTSTSYHSVLDVDSMDPGVDPCTDFFTYSCGGWLKKNPIPPDKTSWGLSSKLADDNRVLLREILEEAAAPAPDKDPVKQKIGDYYTACMDEKTIEAAGTSPLKAQSGANQQNAFQTGHCANRCRHGQHRRLVRLQLRPGLQGLHAGDR